MPDLVLVLESMTQIPGQQALNLLADQNIKMSEAKDALKRLNRLIKNPRQKGVSRPPLSEVDLALLGKEAQFAERAFDKGCYQTTTQRVNQLLDWVRQCDREYPCFGEYQGELRPTDIGLNPEEMAPIELTLNEMDKNHKYFLALLAYECCANRIRHLMRAHNIFETAAVFQTSDAVPHLPHLYQKLEAYTLPSDPEQQQRCTLEIIRRDDGFQSLRQAGDRSEVYTVVRDEPYCLLAEYSEADLVVHVFTTERLVGKLHSNQIIPRLISNDRLWTKTESIGEFFPAHECMSYIEPRSRWRWLTSPIGIFSWIRNPFSTGFEAPVGI